MNDEEAAAAKAEYIRRKYLATAPGDSSTKEYIANKYLASSDDHKSKKKKKKVPKRIQKGNIGIIDEEDDGWRRTKPQEEDIPMATEEPTVTETRSLYTPTSSGWTTIREGEMDVEEEEAEDEKPMI